MSSVHVSLISYMLFFCVRAHAFHAYFSTDVRCDFDCDNPSPGTKRKFCGASNLEVVGVGLIPKNCRRSTPRCKRVEPHVHVTCAHVDNESDGRSRTKRFQEPPQYFSSVAPIFGAQAPLFEIVRLRVAVYTGRLVRVLVIWTCRKRCCYADLCPRITAS